MASKKVYSGPLTWKQLRQRWYAAEIKAARARAAKKAGGKGRIVQRSFARKLRSKFGLNGPSRRPLTQKEINQRQYAALMRGIRQRTAARPGGKGPIALRKPAATLRKKLGLGPPRLYVHA